MAVSANNNINHMNWLSQPKKYAVYALVGRFLKPGRGPFSAGQLRQSVDPFPRGSTEVKLG